MQRQEKNADIEMQMIKDTKIATQKRAIQRNKNQETLKYRHKQLRTSSALQRPTLQRSAFTPRNEGQLKALKERRSLDLGGSYKSFGRC